MISWTMSERSGLRKVAPGVSQEAMAGVDAPSHGTELVVVARSVMSAAVLV